MKKVLFFIPTLTGGGAEKVLINAVNRLNPDKYHIVVQTLIDTGIRKKDLAAFIEYKSIVYCKNKFFVRLFSYLIRFVLPAKWVYQRFVKNDYDVEIAFLEGFPVKLIAASTEKKSKKYTWVHVDLAAYYDSGKLFKNQDRNYQSYCVFDRIFCVSQNVLESFEKRFQKTDSLRVQYNVVDDDAIRKLSLEDASDMPLCPQGTTMIAIGRLCNQKGFDRLIRVAKKLKEEHLLFLLYIFGEGEEKEELEALIREYRLQDHVILKGFTDNPYPYLRKADIMVSSSRFEGFSTVVTEALLLGKPVVTTDCSGMYELLGESGCGIICENDEDALFCALCPVLRDPSVLREMTQKAVIRGKIFSAEKRIQEYESILDE